MSRLEELIAELCPDGVEYKMLGEVFVQFSGMGGVSNKWANEGNCRFIDYMNAYKHVSIDVTDLPFATVKKLDQNILKQGDVLFTSASETPDECAISSVIEDKIEDGIFLDDHLFGLRLNEDYNGKVSPSYLKYAFRAKSFRSQMKKAVRGVTRFYVSKPDFMRLRIPVPPLEVQREIAHVLDNFTFLSAELSAELSARGKQYEFYRTKLLSFDSQIKWTTLGNIGKVSMCKRIMKNETSSEGDIPFFKIGTFGKQADAFISRDTFEKYKSQYAYPNKGDILISAAGTVGRTVVFDGKPAYFQDSNIVWVSNDETRVLNEFLYYWYQTNPWKVSTGGTIARLYNDNIAGARVPVLPLEKQRKIIQVLNRFKNLCTDITVGLPAEIEARQKQYEYYRDKLLTFKELQN